jgi:phosphoribosylanthranilate isomerase
MVVKFCGITRLVDARAAVNAGATWLGFNFYPPSPRYIAPEKAAGIIAELPRGIVSVGVFVNEPPAVVEAIARQAGLSRVQLHGDEPPADLAALAAWQPLKALALRTSADLARLDDYPDALLLIDAPSPDFGGSGQTGDWALAHAAAARRRILLAGGLRPENVAEAVRQVQPWGVDVASGVESAKGIKSAELVHAFCRAAMSRATA